MVLVQVPGAREPQAREAKAIALDKEHDLALLRISGAPLPAVTFGNSEAVRDGQSIAFTGFPDRQCARVPSGHAPRHHRVADADRDSRRDGEAARRARRPEPEGRLRSSLFQLDATAYPGHSGSPALRRGYRRGASASSTWAC